MATIALLVNSIKGHGGIQKDYKLWFDMFKERGHEVYLFVLEKPEIDEKNIIYLKGLTLFQKGMYLNKVLSKIGKIDLFLINAEYMRKYINKKFLNNYYITVHNTWSVGNRKGLRKYFFLRRLYSKYENQPLIGISQNVIDNIVNNFNIKIKKGLVIYSPYDINKIKKHSEEEKVTDNYILAVGGFLPRKRFDVLIKAFDVIKDKISENLYIIGEGPIENEIKSLVSSLKLNDRIKFLGFKENPYPYIKNAKLLALSSDSEGLPRVIVESLILHTPVVTTKSSDGIFEVMTDELRDFVTEKGNYKKFADKMLQALNNYPKITDKYYKKFDIEYCYKKFMELI